MIEFIDGHLKASCIHLSSSHIAAGMLMVLKDKSNGMLRVVHNYRVFNVRTVKDHTPFPQQDNIIEYLARAIIYGKIDLVCAYY